MKIKQIKNITDKINFGKSYDTPTPINEDLPRIYNIMLVCGSKGSGRGVIVNHYLQLAEASGYKNKSGEKVEQRIIWCSGGTSNSKQNQILDELKYLDKDDRIDLDLDNPDKQLKELYNKFRTHVRKKYPDEYKKVQEASMTGAGASFNAGSGEGYMSPYAFGDNKRKKKKAYIGYKEI